MDNDANAFRKPGTSWSRRGARRHKRPGAVVRPPPQPRQRPPTVRARRAPGHPLARRAVPPSQRTAARDRDRLFASNTSRKSRRSPWISSGCPVGMSVPGTSKARATRSVGNYRQTRVRSSRGGDSGPLRYERDGQPLLARSLRRTSPSRPPKKPNRHLRGLLAVASRRTPREASRQVLSGSTVRSGRGAMNTSSRLEPTSRESTLLTSTRLGRRSLHVNRALSGPHEIVQPKVRPSVPYGGNLTMLSTLHTWFATPASIAGGTRSVWCDRNGNVAIDDVLIAGVAALDHEILDGSGESRLAEERGEELLRAAGAMTRLAEGDEGIAGKRRDDVAGRRDRRQAVGGQPAGGRPMAPWQLRERERGGSGESGFYRVLSHSLSGPAQTTAASIVGWVRPNTSS